MAADIRNNRTGTAGQQKYNAGVRCGGSGREKRRWDYGIQPRIDECITGT